MGDDILKVTFIGIMPYLAPIVAILGSVIVARALGDTIASAFGAIGGRKGRY